MEIKVLEVHEVGKAKVILAENENDWLVGVAYGDKEKITFWDLCGKRSYWKRTCKIEDAKEGVEDYKDKAKHNYIFG